MPTITVAFRAEDTTAIKFGCMLAEILGQQASGLDGLVLNLTPERRCEKQVLLQLQVTSDETTFLAANQRILSSSDRRRGYRTGRRILRLTDLQLSRSTRETRTNLVVFDTAKDTVRKAFGELRAALLRHVRNCRRTRKPVHHRPTANRSQCVAPLHPANVQRELAAVAS